MFFLRKDVLGRYGVDDEEGHFMFFLLYFHHFMWEEISC